MLRRRHRVTACASISEAGEALDGAVPDAVVSDVQLPDGDGVTFYGNNARRQMDPDVWQPRSRTVANELKAVDDLPPCSVIDKPVLLRLLNRVIEGTERPS
jgi:DNA-binding NtrC family response regulator